MRRLPGLAVLGAAALLGLAVAEGKPAPAPTIHMCTAPNLGKPGGGGGGGFSLVGDMDRRWKDRTSIHIRFLGGDDELRFNIERFAKEWTYYANLYLDFNNSEGAEIRVAFEQNGQSWSKVGRDALSVPKKDPTVNFGWFNAKTPLDEVRRTSLHEFGHVLGFIHEHQSPKAGIHWNKPKVYDYFKKNDGWDKDKVDQNIFKQYSSSSMNASAFDPKSIMLYPIPRELTTDGFETKMNTELSELDRRHAARLYPWTPHALVKVTNETPRNLSFEYRWKGDKEWRGISGKRLRAGWYERLWRNAGTQAKFPALELRFDNGQGKTETVSVTPFAWKPVKEGDYPDFERGGRCSFVLKDGKVALVKR